jgi:hypothetical protein
VEVDIGHLLTGNPAIDETTKALTAILARTGEGMDRVGLDPQAFGRLLHAAFALQVKLARLPGIGPDDVETTFSREPGARYGSKHSIRTDVVLRNEAGDIIAIYDVKTGNADLSLRRVLELLEKTGAAPGTPVIQLHLTRGPSRKAEQVGPEVGSHHTSLQVTGRRV